MYHSSASVSGVSGDAGFDLKGNARRERREKGDEDEDCAWVAIGGGTGGFGGGVGCSGRRGCHVDGRAGGVRGGELVEVCAEEGLGGFDVGKWSIAPHHPTLYTAPSSFSSSDSPRNSPSSSLLIPRPASAPAPSPLLVSLHPLPPPDGPQSCAHRGPACRRGLKKTMVRSRCRSVLARSLRRIPINAQITPPSVPSTPPPLSPPPSPPTVSAPLPSLRASSQCAPPPS